MEILVVYLIGFVIFGITLGILSEYEPTSIFFDDLIGNIIFTVVWPLVALVIIFCVMAYGPIFIGQKIFKSIKN